MVSPHKTILVAGALANKHRNGGEAWARLNWVLGLRRLGFGVWFVEQIDDTVCLDEAGQPSDFENSANLRFFRSIVERFDLVGAAALLRTNGSPGWGLSLKEICDAADSAVALVNVSGHLRLDTVRRRARRTIYVDLDPGYTQFWAADGHDMGLEGHDVYLTVGENIGRPECSIPTVGLTWQRKPRFLVLNEWPVTSNGDQELFTTVASWRSSFGSVEVDGHRFGLKAHEFRKFIDLPSRAPQRFQIALDIHPGDDKDLEALQRHGWEIVEPRQVASDPLAFREYVHRSGGEFSVGQGIYVETASGWVSDRTVRYLAAGRPALVQDTGFSRNYPVGEGWIPFRTPAQAAEGAKRIARDYDAHAAAARALAVEYFDSDRVLPRLLEEAGVGV